MQNIPFVYIAITEGKQRLEISGGLDLFKKFMAGVTGSAEPTVSSTEPDPTNALMTNLQSNSAKGA